MSYILKMLWIEDSATESRNNKNIKRQAQISWVNALLKTLKPNEVGHLMKFCMPKALNFLLNGTETQPN